MKYLVRVQYSQTDSANVLVKAETADEAVRKALRGSSAINHSGVWQVDREIK